MSINEARLNGPTLMATAVAMLAAGLLLWARELPAAEMKPSEGWSLHIDALRHFPAKPALVAHHYCKSDLAGGLVECQLYDSDAPNARLAGVEVVVGADVWKKFGAEERKLWHYHKTEIPKVKATLPDLSAEEAAKVAKSLEETYGKIYLLWDPGRRTLPTGRPGINIIK